MRAKLAIDLTNYVMRLIALLLGVILVILLWPYQPLPDALDGKSFGAQLLRHLEPEKRIQLIQILLTALLPLFGTWVGTVLSHYYSKEAFREAAQANQGGTSATASVLDRMIPRTKLKVMSLAADRKLDDVKVADVQAWFADARLENGRALWRMPVLSANGVFVAIVHRATFEQMLARFIAAAQNDNTIVDQGTLKALLDQTWDATSKTTYRSYVTNSIAPVNIRATVPEADGKRRSVPNCADVVVTVSGGIDDVVVGWLTEGEMTARSA